MIKKIEKDDSYIEELEKSFPQFLEKNSVRNRIKNNPFTNFYIEIKEEKIVGFINYDLIYDRGELIDIAVVEHEENKGLGTKLLEFMIKDCTEKEIKSITLEVKITNKKAIHLYEKFGFTKVAIREKYYQGIDGILMEKELI